MEYHKKEEKIIQRDLPQALSKDDYVLVHHLSNGFMMHQEALNDKKKFKALLFDLIPTQRIEVNILMQIFEMGFVQEIRHTTESFEILAYRISKQIRNEYGTSKALADRMATIWIECYNRMNQYTQNRQKKKVEITFLIETSSALYGEKIAALNNAIQSTIVDLKYLFKEQGREGDAIFITFSEKAECEYAVGDSLDDLIFNDLSASQSDNCNLGKVLEYLEDELEMFRYAETDINPIFVFMLASQPTDDYASSLAKLNDVAYFKNAPKLLYIVGNQISHTDLSLLCKDKNLIVVPTIDKIVKEVDVLIKEKI